MAQRGKCRAKDNPGVILPAPMLLHQGKRPQPFEQPDWIYELKFDGYRLVAGVQDGHVKLATRKGAECTRWFPEVVQGLAHLAGGPHVLDGEVCVLDELGARTSIDCKTAHDAAASILNVMR